MSGQPCPDCDGQMVRSMRYEATETVPVLCCWDCGAETPALYKRRARRPEPAPLTCLQCGGPRQTGLRYCSMRCYGAAKALPRVACVCSVCGRAFSVSASDGRRGRGSACSRSCAMHRRYQAGKVV